MIKTFLTHLTKLFGRFCVSVFRRCGLVFLLWSTFILVGYWYRSETQGDDICSSYPKLCGRVTEIKTATDEDITTPAELLSVVRAVRFTGAEAQRNRIEKNDSDESYPDTTPVESSYEDTTPVDVTDTVTDRSDENDDVTKTTKLPIQFLPTVKPVEGEYEDRRSRVSKVCQTVNITDAPSSVANKIFFKKRSVFYCGNLKVATTFMDGFLPHIFGCGNSTDCFFRPTDYKELVNKAYSFTIVRDPYERLFSGYENKLFLPNKFWSTLGTDIVAAVRQNPPWASIAIGHDVHFEEVVKYVVMKGSSENLNPHLMPMHKLCNPCPGSFNFIGKLETMSNDIDNLVADLKRNTRVNQNVSSSFEIEATVRQKQLIGPVHHLFLTLGFLRTYAPAMRRKLRRQNLLLRTWTSYQIRGIILKQISMPFTPKEHVTHRMFVDAVLSAAEKSAPHKTQLKRQREEALIQAYRRVPLELMEKLRDFVSLDCRLFGYDERPAKLFERPNTTDVEEFNYFVGLYFPKPLNSTSESDDDDEEE